MKLRLIDDWRRVLKRAWSVRLMFLAAVLTAIEFILPLFSDSPPLPRGTWAALSFVIVAGAFVARFVAQKDD